MLHDRSAAGWNRRTGIETLENRTLLNADLPLVPLAPALPGAPAVTGLVIYNNDTGQPVGPLGADGVIDLAQIGTNNVSIGAEVSSVTRSVRFGLDAQADFHAQNGAPYAILSDTNGTNFLPWTPSAGDHTLKVTPYPLPNTTGLPGAAVSLSFKVLNSAPEAPAAPAPEAQAAPAAPAETAAANLDADSNPKSGNDAPKVSLIDVPDGKRAAPAYFALRASASDADGGIQKVEFYVNGKLIGTTAGAPYTVAWVDAPAGDYTIVAKAYDNDGASKTSAEEKVSIVNVGGDTIYVSPDGSDSNSGRSDRPVRSIGKAASMARPGDTVLVRDGTYKEEVRLTQSGTPAKPIRIVAENTGGAIIDGSGKKFSITEAYRGAAEYIDIVGLTVRNTDNNAGGDKSAIVTTNGWRLFDVTVEKVEGNGIGIFGEYVSVVRSVSRDNGCSGIGGSSIRNGLLYDSKSSGNNTKKHSGSFEGGGGKFTRVRSFLVEKYESYDNLGPGIWFDGDNIGSAVRNSSFHHNRTLWDGERQKIGGTGVLFEISGIHKEDGEGPLLAEGNKMYDNDLWGLVVYASRNVTVRDNTFSNNSIELKDNRDNPWMIEDLTITDNHLKKSWIVADKPTASDYKSEGFVIDKNVYDNGGEKLIKWVDKTYTSVSSLRSALGLEKGGRTATL